MKNVRIASHTPVYQTTQLFIAPPVCSSHNPSAHHTTRLLITTLSAHHTTRLLIRQPVCSSHHPSAHHTTRLLITPPVCSSDNLSAHHVTTCSSNNPPVHLYHPSTHLATHLLSQKLPVPAHHGSSAQAARIQVGKHIQREEAWQHSGEVHVFERHALVEPVLNKVQLVLTAVIEEHVEEASPLRVRPEVKL